MANIFKRLRTVISANMNAQIDKIENPEAMLDEYIRELEKNINEVRNNTASVMAIATGLERRIKVCEESIAEYNEFAKKAVNDGKDDDARRFIEERIALENTLSELNESLIAASANALEMTKIYETLNNELCTLKKKRDLLKSKITVANTQKMISKSGKGYVKADRIVSNFADIENKINRQIDEANAFDILINGTSKDSINALRSNYSSTANKELIEEELKALKAS